MVHQNEQERAIRHLSAAGSDITASGVRYLLKIIDDLRSELRARSSAGEQADHTRQVGGSNPPAPTIRAIEWRCPACGRVRGDGCGRDNNKNRVGCYLLGGPLTEELGLGK